jgi:phosphoribosylformimino-5-aminoimidazole carboxamide ribotide isomerase
VRIIPSIDLASGRSRVVYWPGAASGVGAPTDQPARIARRFVDLGAELIHLVDFDGARAAAPVNLESIGAIASLVATPLQVAGGMESPEGIRLAFAAGATRAVASMSVVDDVDRLRACLDAAGDWLAIGFDPRPDRLAAYPWRRPTPPSAEGLIDELAALGVGRLVVSHGGGASEVVAFATLMRRQPAMEISVAGGVQDLDGVRRLRDAGVAALILGEVLFSGALDFADARRAADPTQ